MTNTRKAIGTYAASTAPSEGGHYHNATACPLPYAAFDKHGHTWRVSEADAQQIDATKGGDS